MPTLSHPVILLDDECVMCSWIVRLIYRYDTNDVFRFCGLQSETGKKLSKAFAIPIQKEESVILLCKDGYFVQSKAVKRILKSLPGLNWLSALLSILPNQLTDLVYKIIARNRYRFFGKLNTCRILPGLEKKFI